MRIAFISYEYPPDTPVGGIGSYTYQVSRLLAKANFEVHIFSGSHIQTATSLEDGVVTHRVKCVGPQDFGKNVLSHFAREHFGNPFQLIESPEIHANAIGIKQNFPSVPLIVRLHASNHIVERLKKRYVPFINKLRYFLGAIRRGKWDMGYWRAYDYKKDPDYLFARLADYISAPTLQMKKLAVKNWSIPAGRIKVIENPFIENPIFKTARTVNEEQIIIFYGRLNVLKGLITATKAMKYILENNPAWKWMIVGDDGVGANGLTSMKKWMINYLENVKEQILFYGSVPNKEIPFYLKKASVVLIPSLFESFSYVTIEAMCAGKAVIGSKVAGTASLIENNVTGKLVAPHRVKEWQKAIKQLITDKELRRKLGRAAYEYSERKHLMNREVVRYYKDISPLTPVNT